ncbi:glycosyltransferase [Anderseniella sp. Alg231-50]|uniref:glycosyltransferase n=1 Tax=Anderseniella sp. Alg231-50 TaxID=1922226 RepID=UPI000D5510B3
MRILLVTDAWHPQVNGVVRTLTRTMQGLEDKGHEVMCLTPDGARTIPMPTYPEIRLALVTPAEVSRRISGFAPDCVHIATEGPLGWMARRHCLKHNMAFTTSFHSRFPEMLVNRLPIPGLERLAYALLRRFHAPAAATLVPTPTVTRRLGDLGFSNLKTWTRGVDTDLFKPHQGDVFEGLARPVMLCAGRVAVEKNIEAFLQTDLPGTKVVVGDGPQLAELKQRYPDTVFTGYRTGDDLARTLSSADVFVFPSKTDTFGLVMLEALACGVPVAAFPVEGPIDVITSPRAGVLDDDLATAISAALKLDRQDCIDFAKTFSWDRVTEQFEASLVPADRNPPNHRRAASGRAFAGRHTSNTGI